MRSISQRTAVIIVIMAANMSYADKLRATVSKNQNNQSRSFVMKLRVDPVSRQICHPRHPWEC